MTKIDFTRTDQSYDIANGINTMLWTKMSLLAEKKPTACRFCAFPAAAASTFVIIGGRTAAVAEPVFKALGNFILFPFKKDCHFTKGFFQLGVAITRVVKLALIPFDILGEISAGAGATIKPALAWNKAIHHKSLSEDSTFFPSYANRTIFDNLQEVTRRLDNEINENHKDDTQLSGLIKKDYSMTQLSFDYSAYRKLDKKSKQFVDIFVKKEFKNIKAEKRAAQIVDLREMATTNTWSKLKGFR